LYGKIKHPFFVKYTFSTRAGIANCYGLDGSGIESRWGQDLPHPPRKALESTQPPTQWVPCLSRG